jgi:hypothetical protein
MSGLDGLSYRNRMDCLLPFAFSCLRPVAILRRFCDESHDQRLQSVIAFARGRPQLAHEARREFTVDTVSLFDAKKG